VGSTLAVRDLDSTNGVIVVGAAGSETEVGSLAAVALSDGDAVELGRLVVTARAV
jgi:pSer/pThr/pTyr-binding forkhead associated (FHA) protein